MDKYKDIKIPEDTFCTETHVGPTPNGGVYSTAIYSNKWHEPCTKEDACYIEISEFDKNGNRVGGVYGFCGDEKKREFTDEEKEFFCKIEKCFKDVERGMSLLIALRKNNLSEMTKVELMFLYNRGMRVGLFPKEDQ